MALDIYVGPLSRYYAGLWKPILLQWAEASRESGEALTLSLPGEEEVSAEVLDATASRTAAPGPAAAATFLAENGDTLEAWDLKTNRRLIQPASLALDTVSGWTAALNTALQENLSEPIEWREDQEGVYFTDKPGWSAYYSLVLWAAYDEHPELSRLARAPETLDDDSAYRASIAPTFDSLYTQLLGVEMWLPGARKFVFTAEDASGKKTRFGFTEPLFHELQLLNSRTWMAGQETLEAWRKEAPLVDAALEDHAKFGFAVHFELTRRAVEHGLPMVLDY